MIFAHEFFDALPVHKLKKTEKGWREILIDIKDSNEIPENGEELRYIISRESTPASKLLLDPEEQKEEVEVCPDAGLLVKELSVLIKENGGAALIIDYGHNGTEGDTLRAFKKHRQVSPLITPGECDVTCDVDFSYLKKQLGKEILVYGPVQQNFFLKNMGIELRLNKLLQNCSKKSIFVFNIKLQNAS
ncbi:NADH dehydrogenase [ubiquinone] complex I, assembly factor 7 [Armadillidium nasatum]|uniref:Protein arginine methyltransferase NDUFAF7 n=1 Tax=Armadillidium nasatum TaxID=96803 RepID=A0A5N5STP4_9CRUS|nr:NADH dehydrogenase [ubiquinone] complex I, assembly factor 7 [Armadillidium nasatum]